MNLDSAFEISIKSYVAEAGSLISHFYRVLALSQARAQLHHRQEGPCFHGTFILGKFC